MSDTFGNNGNSPDIQLYAQLLTSSLNVDCSKLLASLDDSMKIFENYLRLVDKSEVELVNYFENVDINLEKKQNEVKGLFNKIDNLELFVECLKQNYNELEKKMDAAEKRLGRGNKLKKFFDSKLSTSPSVPAASLLSSASKVTAAAAASSHQTQAPPRNDSYAAEQQQQQPTADDRNQNESAVPKNDNGAIANDNGGEFIISFDKSFGKK